MITVMDRLTQAGMFRTFLPRHRIPGTPNAHANVFLVEKRGGGAPPLLRFITDARFANCLTSNTLGYNIFTLQALFQTISNMSHQCNSKGYFYVINADLRHWFHQIPIPPRLSALFQVRRTDLAYWQITLPMGWYLAPPIAQTATWAFLLSKIGGHPQYVGDAHKFEEMPSWIPFQKDGKLVGGGLFVLQDNIFIITDDIAIATYWKDRMLHLSKKENFNIKFKGEGPVIQKLVKSTTTSTTDAAQNSNINTNNNNNKMEEIIKTDFFGIEIGFDYWCVSSAKPKDHDIPEKSCDWTYRNVSQMLGISLWDLRVRDVSPLEYTDLLTVYSKVTPPEGKERDDLINLP